MEEAPRLIQDNDQDMSNGNMNRDNGYLVSCKGCRKSFKTVKGLKIHQSRKGCMRKPNEEHEAITGKTGVQCSGGKSPCEASGENCQDQPHSTVYSNAHSNHNDGPKHPKIRWPARAEREMWEEVDKDLNKLLEGTVKGPLKTKLVIFNNIIYNYGEERFGFEKKGGGNQVKCQILSRWQQEIKDLRKELRNLSK